MEVPGIPHQGSSASHAIDELSAEFNSKVSLSYLNAPTLSTTARMQAKLVHHNNLSIIVRPLDGKINLGTLKNLFTKCWQPCSSVSLGKLDERASQIWLQDQEQIAWIIRRQPWIIANKILRIVPWRDIYHRSEGIFQSYFIWATLCNLPEAMMDKDIVEHSLLETGFFSTSQIKTIKYFPSFLSAEGELLEALLKVKLVLDISKPIPPGFYLPEVIQGVRWIPFGFEFLPPFCFRCGFLGHHQLICPWSPGKHVTELYNTRNRVHPRPPGNRPMLTLLDTDATALDTLNQGMEGGTQNLFQLAVVTSNTQLGRENVEPHLPTEAFHALIIVPDSEPQLPALPLAAFPSGPQAFLPLEQFLLNQPRAGLLPGLELTSATTPSLDHLAGAHNRDLGLSFLLDFEGTSAAPVSRPAGLYNFNSDIEFHLSEPYDQNVLSPRQRESVVMISDADSSQDESPRYRRQHRSSSRLGAVLGVRRPRFKNVRGDPAAGLQQSPRAS